MDDQKTTTLLIDSELNEVFLKLNWIDLPFNSKDLKMIFIKDNNYYFMLVVIISILSINYFCVRASSHDQDKPIYGQVELAKDESIPKDLYEPFITEKEFELLDSVEKVEQYILKKSFNVRLFLSERDIEKFKSLYREMILSYNKDLIINKMRIDAYDKIGLKKEYNRSLLLKYFPCPSQEYKDLYEDFYLEMLLD
ncbi:MAG: hypothetical protein NTZ68_04080 [Candidatus Dependentiae bacterium]|nr:hypothetical protein [Candidatus Dependentiae bacterium]